MEKYIMALDSGTTSNRCILFDKKGNVYGYNPGAMDEATMEKLIEATLNSSL